MRALEFDPEKDNHKKVYYIENTKTNHSTKLYKTLRKGRGGNDYYKMNVG